MDVLQVTLNTIHRRMRAKQIRRFIGNLDVWGRSAVTIGTVCSGSDMPVYILNKLKAHWESEYGKSIQIHHIFSCDNSATAQSWILKNANPRFLYKDITELGMGSPELTTATTTPLKHSLPIFGGGLPPPGPPANAHHRSRRPQWGLGGAGAPLGRGEKSSRVVVVVVNSGEPRGRTRRWTFAPGPNNQSIQ